VKDGWVRTPTGLVVPGHAVRHKSGPFQPKQAPPGMRLEPQPMNRAERRRMERIVRKEAKKEARHQRTALGQSV